MPTIRKAGRTLLKKISSMQLASHQLSSPPILSHRGQRRVDPCHCLLAPLALRQATARRREWFTPPQSVPCIMGRTGRRPAATGQGSSQQDPPREGDRGILEVYRDPTGPTNAGTCVSLHY